MADRDILKSAFASTPECLTPAQLEMLAGGKDTHPHLDACPRCQAELAMLKSFESSTPLPDEGAAVAWISSHLDRQMESIKHPSRARSASQSLETRGSWLATLFSVKGLRWVLPATVVTAMAIVGVILLQPPKEPDLQANAGGTSPIYRSEEVRIVSPVGEVRAPQTLQWEPFPGAQTYKAVLMEVDNSQLWSAESKDASVEIPASIRAKMLPGKPILWQVTALDASGRVLGTSQVQRFSTPREHSSEKVPSRQ